MHENHARFKPPPTILLALTLKRNSCDVQAFPPPFMRLDDLPVAGPVLDAERFIEFYRPLKTSESLRMFSTTKAIGPKSSGAVVQTETLITDESDQPVARIVSSTSYVGTKLEHGRGHLRF